MKPAQDCKRIDQPFLPRLCWDFSIVSAEFSKYTNIGILKKLSICSKISKVYFVGTAEGHHQKTQQKTPNSVYDGSHGECITKKTAKINLKRQDHRLESNLERIWFSVFHIVLELKFLLETT